jgi:hypothetical protein
MLIVLVLVVVATVYENSLSSGGFQDAGLVDQEQRSRKSSLVDTKSGSQDTDRLEMNYMSNNNNNNDADCEPEKLKRQKLGSLLCREILM